MPRTTLLRVSIPARLQDEMLLKTAGYFDIPNTPAGIEFQQWWETAPAKARDDLMRKASSDGTSLIEALYGNNEDA